jgi:hypothetical protein
MTGIGLEDVSKDQLGGLAVLHDQRGSCRFDLFHMRVGNARPFIGKSSVRIFLEVNEHIAVGEPRDIERRRRLQHAPQLPSRIIPPPGATIGARKIGSCMRKSRRCGHRPFESLDGLRHLILREQRHPQQAKAVHVARGGGLNRTKLTLRSFGLPGTQSTESSAVSSAQCRLCIFLHVVSVSALQRRARATRGRVN